MCGSWAPVATTLAPLAARSSLKSNCTYDVHCRAAWGDTVVEKSTHAEVDGEVDVTAHATTTAANSEQPKRRTDRQYVRHGQLDRAAGMCIFCCMSLPPSGDLVGLKHAFSSLLPRATTSHCRLCHGPLNFEESWVHHLSGNGYSKTTQHRREGQQ